MPSAENWTFNGALPRHLDANHDRPVDAHEWKAAADALRTLDHNGDELIGAGELVAEIRYPGATANVLQAPASRADADVPLVVLPRDEADASAVSDYTVAPR